MFSAVALIILRTS